MQYNVINRLQNRMWLCSIVIENVVFPEPVNSASKTLEWLMEQIEGDSIEDVTDEMLDKLVSGHLAGNGYCKFLFVIFENIRFTMLPL